MKKLLIVLCALLCMTSCGPKIDKNAVIEGNGGALVIREGVSYELMGEAVFEGERLVANISSSDGRLFILGEYAYVNTVDGAKQIRLSDGRISDFGRGEIVAAMGENLYYKIVELFWVNMRTGKQGSLINSDAAFLGSYGRELYFWSFAEDETAYYATTCDITSATEMGRTAGRFVPEGFVANDEAVMFKTGEQYTQFMKRSEWFVDESDSR
ncbi:MAG: hypothetical protein Q4C12_05390 [Clostridia bacterium]|nr:hypothetical protein [Clostridia bacterium]